MIAALAPAAIGAVTSLLAAYGSKPKINKPNYKGYLTSVEGLKGRDYGSLRNAMLDRLASNAGNSLQSGAMNLQSAGVRGADQAANIRGISSDMATQQGAVEAQIQDLIEKSKLQELQNYNAAIEAENRQLAQDYGLEYGDYTAEKAANRAQFAQGMNTLGSGLGEYFASRENPYAKTKK